MNNASPISNWLESRGHTPSTYWKEIVLARIFLVVAMYAILLSIFPLFIHYAKVLFPPSSPKTPSSLSPQEILFMLSMSIYFNSLWIIVIPQVSGWRKLVHNFPAPSDYKAEQEFKKQKITVGIFEYNALFVGISPQGLSLASTFPFRLTHRPILIPWQQIVSIHRRQFFGRTIVHLVIGSPRIGTMTIKNKEILEAARPWLPQHE